MKAPMKWLNEYVDINLSLKELMWKMTEVGLTTESYENRENDVVLDAEVTPNRPDWMSIIGIAREISAIQNSPLRLPKIKPLPEKKADLPIKIKNDFMLCPRFSAVTIKGVSLKQSPLQLQERLLAGGLRPINNLIDITNYVMFETGNPIHVFDYDKLENGEMSLLKSKGGEEFISVDNKKYHLPKNSIIFKSGDKVVDLCGIKGGLNSGISENTTNILILVAVYNGQLIRRTSQFLSLWSEASRIFERGANLGGTLDTLLRTANLMLDSAGGKIASEIVDTKKEDYIPRKVILNHDRLQTVLGIKIDTNQVLKILEKLFLSPKLVKDIFECLVPTYRSDIQIEEDLIEEVARLYGYNNFPKTLPVGELPIKSIPFFKDYGIDRKIKNTLTAAGFSEIQTYSLISEKDIQKMNINSENVLRVDNPVSLEFEYLRPNLKSGLIKALKDNKPWFDNIDLFELGKIYLGKSITTAKEMYQIAGITNSRTFYDVKGLIERIFYDFQVIKNPSEFIEANDKFVYFSFPYSLLENKTEYRKFKPLPKYPPIIEDMAFKIPGDVKIDVILKIIKTQSNLIAEVKLYDKYQDIRTFRIYYQHPDRNLSSADITPVRNKIINNLDIKGVTLK